MDFLEPVPIIVISFWKLGVIMNIKALLSRLTIVSLITLACSTPAFCGEIHDAAKDGNLAKVNALLTENPNLVFGKDNDGWTLLREAAENGHKDVLELLLANKADVNAKDKEGETPLYWAEMGATRTQLNYCASMAVIHKTCLEKSNFFLVASRLFINNRNSVNKGIGIKEAARFRLSFLYNLST
jgi:hypothetical protein